MISDAATRFDRWYATMAGDQLRDDVVGAALGVPVDLHVTGLLPGAGLDEVVAALDLAEHDVLVDLACGRGGYSRMIARRTGATVIGVDISPIAIDLARADLAGDDLVRGDPAGDDPAREDPSPDEPADRPADRSERRVRFEVGAMEDSGLDGGFADAVLCIDSYQFASSPSALAGEAARIVRPNGRLVLTGAMPRVLADGPREDNPVLQAMSTSGWQQIEFRVRPDWLATEQQFWAAVVAEPTDLPRTRPVVEDCEPYSISKPPQLRMNLPGYPQIRAMAGC